MRVERRARSRSVIKKQKGAVAVGFAFIFPVLLTIVFGIVETGLGLYDKAVITNAAREGARAGIVLKSPPRQLSDIQNVVNNYTSTYLVTFASGGRRHKPPRQAWATASASRSR
jgi:Flp pilus assembly protein TadG